MKPLTIALTLALFAAVASADTIFMTDGTSLKDVTVVEEGILEVTYRPDGKTSESKVKSEKVLTIEFSRKPKDVDEADAAIDDGNLGDGVGGFQSYLEAIEGGERARYKWAPAYAMWRLVEVHQSVGDASGVVKFTDRLINKAPETRYVPQAYLAKAQAQSQLGDAGKSEETLLALRKLIDDKSLSQRWRLDCDLSLVLLDSKLTNDQKRDRILEIGAEAGSDYPSVRDRARVAEGEAYLGSSKFDEALEVFKGITADPTADAATLAGAYAGAGECYYQQAVTLINAEQDASAVVEEGLLAFLHAVSFKEQAQYRPKALLYSGRLFDLKDDDESRTRAKRMYRAVLTEYPDSPWALEAKKF